MFSLLLKGAKVIDPSQGIQEVLDIAIKDEKIVRLQKEIKEKAKKVLDLRGKVAVPGFIDMHTHVYWGGTSISVNPDKFARQSGVTTFVDAGSAGPGNFLGFKNFVIDSSRSRILAFLNISYPGIYCLPKDEKVGELFDLRLVKINDVIEIGQKYSKDILGIKVRLGIGSSGPHGLIPLYLAKQAAEYLDKPIMVHIAVPPPTIKEILPILRKGDILTHIFRGMPNAPIDPDGRVFPELLKARQRGIIMDIGHGVGSFSFKVARAMIKQGFLPDTISSDIHVLGVHGPTFDLPTTLSKMLNLGMTLHEVIRAATQNPAKIIGLESKIGTLKEGSIADICVLEIKKGAFIFKDCFGEEIQGNVKIDPVLTIMGGEVWE